MRSSARPARGAALAVLVAFASAAAGAAPIVAVDDAGRTLTLARPAARVVTLAPSLTELVFAAGGGGAVVATDSSSDYPAAVRSLPRVGDAARLDVERIVALQPDLVVVWRHGNTTREIDQLEAIGLHVFRLEPQRLDEVARAIERLGVVLGQESTAQSAAEALRAALGRLRDRHATAAPVRVFYQVWSSPLMTVNRGQIVNDVIELCGGRNVFASLAPLVPQVTTESVLAAGPEVILTSDEVGAGTLLRRDPGAAAFAVWRRHATLAAVKGGWLYTLNGDAISRQGPRIVDGATAVCEALDEVRRERGPASPASSPPPR
jgi:iron complex transport system substrate-binding protein